MNQQEKELIALSRKTDETGVTSRDLARFHDIWERGKNDREKDQKSLRVSFALLLSFIPPIMLGGYSLGANLGQPPMIAAVFVVTYGLLGLLITAFAVRLFQIWRVVTEIQRAF
jgi:hypothetical protein